MLENGEITKIDYLGSIEAINESLKDIFKATVELDKYAEKLGILIHSFQTDENDTSKQDTAKQLTSLINSTYEELNRSLDERYSQNPDVAFNAKNPNEVVAEFKNKVSEIREKFRQSSNLQLKEPDQASAPTSTVK